MGKNKEKKGPTKAAAPAAAPLFRGFAAMAASSTSESTAGVLPMLAAEDHLSMEVLSWLDGPSLVRMSMANVAYRFGAPRAVPRAGCGAVTLQALLPLAAQAQWPNLTAKYSPLGIPGSLILEGTKQFYVEVGKEAWKFDTLVDLFEMMTIAQCIVYVKSDERGKWLLQEMENREFTSIGLKTTDMSQRQCDLVDRQFRMGAYRTLIMTNGLLVGIGRISVKVCFDVPLDFDSYIQAHGLPTGANCRASILFLGPGDGFRWLDAAQEYFGTSIEEMPMNIVDLV